MALEPWETTENRLGSQDLQSPTGPTLSECTCPYSIRSIEHVRAALRYTPFPTAAALKHLWNITSPLLLPSA